MTGASELRLHSIALPARVRPLRHALGTFFLALGIDAEPASDIVLAVGEVLLNVVEHAYERSEVPGSVEVFARLEDDEMLAVDVFDSGAFIERPRRPGRGFGLRIARAIAAGVLVERNGGTRVRMRFRAPRTMRGAVS